MELPTCPEENPCPDGLVPLRFLQSGVNEECVLPEPVGCPIFLSPMPNLEYTLTDNANSITILDESTEGCPLVYSYEVVDPAGGAALTFNQPSLTWTAFYMDDLLLASD